MKATLSRNLLELALSHAYDATEKKASESFCQLDFSSNNLKITTKGAFTAYEESLAVIKCDEAVKFSVKTSTLLEFVRHINAEDLIMSYDSNKNNFLISSGDKKSKLAIQSVNITFDPIVDAEENIYEIPNSNELISKLSFASRFCSNNFQDHPLTGIHCSFEKTKLILKSTNGATFYSSEVQVEGKEISELYLHKKTFSILKNIFDSESLQKISINKNSIVLKSLNNCLQIFIEKAVDNFPNQINDWLDKESSAEIKVSTFELIKSLKFFNGIFGDASVQINAENNILELSCKEKTSEDKKESNMAAKESVVVEHLSGTTKSAYNSKYFLDCLDSLQSTWVELKFINMHDSFDLCKMTANNTLILLCPAIF